MGKLPYEEGTPNQKQAQGHEAGRTGLRESPAMPRESYILSARCGQEGHHVLRESDEKVSWTGCSWRKQVTLSVFCSASIFLPATMKAEARMDQFIELRSHGISRASIETKIAFAHNRCCCFVVAENGYIFSGTPRVQIRLERVIITS